MPPKILEWSRDNPAEQLRQAAQALEAGQLVALPTDTVYTLAAPAFTPASVARLAECAGSDSVFSVALADPIEVADWLPYLRGAGNRLTRHAWPGPMILRSRAGVAQGLARLLPEAVRERVVVDGCLTVSTPGHQAASLLMRQIGQPLILADLPAVTGPEAGSAQFGQQEGILLADGATYFGQPASVVRVNGRAVTLERAGVLTEEMLTELTRCRILFVCTGNTCRSPMAMALCSALLARRLQCTPAELPARGFEVLSAGLAAAAGSAASPDAVDIARASGADLGSHRSQPLSAELLARADFLFTMTDNHLRLLQSLDPGLGPPPRMLSPHGEDIADPIGRDPEVYRACARQIQECLDHHIPLFEEQV